MLSPESAEIVRSTLPVIGAKIDEITPIFYRRMFAAHPELERDLFNRGNQAQGDQQRALAGAIAAYATLLVSSPESEVDGLLSRIAHKHASLGIAPDQYPIVHRHLFEAIAQVLGDAATPEIVAAWEEVYWHMAHALIRIEQGLYSRFGVEPHEVWQELIVTARHHESPDTVAFTVARRDGTPLPQALPGQYVSVQVPLADGARQIRQYSLTGAPDSPTWGFTVKAIRESEAAGLPAGEVSTYLHEEVFEGDTLRVSLPFGDLVLEEGSDPVLLVSAGIGCTPIIGMLHHLAREGADRPVTVLHADRSPARHAHRRELADLVGRIDDARLHHWYEDLGSRAATETVRHGRIDLASDDIDPSAEVYLCGPLPFMESVRGQLAERGVPEERIHYEVFGPDTWIPHVDTAGV
ncbi:globin domain-containing protein [Janibacter sp. LM]|uniref:globin domain-containing protein n=1 Tax=Janibacter sp. LM TaxID=3144845 RepID=UPI0031F68DD5